MDIFSWVGDLMDDAWKWATSADGAKTILSTGADYLKGKKGKSDTNYNQYARDATAPYAGGTTRLLPPTESEAAPVAGRDTPVWKGQSWEKDWMLSFRNLIGD